MTSRDILLLLSLALALAAADVEPPAAPNPWNTSQERALRDYLTEQYHQDAPASANLDKLRVLYKRAWNDGQAELLLHGGDVDPRYRTAQATAADASRRDAAMTGLERMGVHHDPTLTTEAIEQLLTDKKAADKKAEQERTAALLAEQDREAARKSVAAAAKSGDGTSTPQTLPPGVLLVELRPVTPADRTITENEFVAKCVAQKSSPLTTAMERASYTQSGHRRFAAWVTLRKSADVILVDGNGIEAYVITERSADPEKGWISFTAFSADTQRWVSIAEVRVRFLDSPRNKNFDHTRQYSDWDARQQALSATVSNYNSGNREMFFDPKQHMQAEISVYTSNFTVAPP